jgi:hypothetical protein
MRTALIAALGIGIWLAASPAIAQNTAAPPSGDTNQSRSGAPDAPTPQAPSASPEEIAHQAMVDEQERRDREAEAERDRDDQG